MKLKLGYIWGEDLILVTGSQNMAISNQISFLLYSFLRKGLMFSPERKIKCFLEEYL